MAGLVHTLDRAMSLRTYLITLTSLVFMTTASAEDSLLPQVESFVKERLAETAEIPEERQKELLKLSDRKSVV